MRTDVIYIIIFCRVLSFRSGASSGMTVALQECYKVSTGGASASQNPDSDDDTSVTNAKWRKLGGEFKTIDLDSIEGRNLPNKLEMLMAALTELQ